MEKIPGRTDRKMAKKELLLSDSAQAAIDETGADPMDDVYAIRNGEHTKESLLAYCLDGCEGDERVDGWREYVDSVVEFAGRA